MLDWTGQKIGNYQIIRVLGHGGFADVYLGQHTYLKTKTAIKVLQARLAENDLQNFLQEARTVANLTHPHIVRVLEFGEEGHTPYLVMDYCSNGTLRQRHPRGTRVPLSTCITYITQAAEALQYAHDRKIIHRDVKPENLLISQNNTILLSDFGISIISQSSRYQRHQDIGGTIAYSAPEQLQGKACSASDQYSLGILLYEWLVGEMPYKGSFAEIASQHLVAPVPTIHDKVPSISLTVEHVLQKALAKDPLQRFQNVHDFALALDQAAEGKLDSTLLRADLIDDQANIATYAKTKLAPPIKPLSTVTSSTVRQTPPFPLPSFDTPPSHTQTRHVGKSGLSIAIIGILFLALVGVSVRSFLTPSGNSASNKSTSSQILNSGQTVVHPTPTLTPTPLPTPTPTPAPRTLTVNRQWLCLSDVSSTCNIAITIVSFTFDTAQQQTSMMLSITAQNGCYGGFFDGLNFQDSSAKNYQSGGQLQSDSTTFSLAPSQTIKLIATYQFVPSRGATYTLEASELYCGLWVNNHDYATTQFTF